MAQAAETLERELVRDPETLADRIGRDEELCGDLYRALTNNRWRKDGGPEGHVSPELEPSRGARERRARASGEGAARASPDGR
jgi:hypothetical protein